MMRWKRNKHQKEIRGQQKMQLKPCDVEFAVRLQLDWARNNCQLAIAYFHSYSFRSIVGSKLFHRIIVNDLISYLICLTKFLNFKHETYKQLDKVQFRSFFHNELASVPGRLIFLACFQTTECNWNWRIYFSPN